MEEKQLPYRLLSYILSHDPTIAKINLDKDGWTDVSQLLKNIKRYKSINVSMNDLEKIVQTSKKTKFIFNDDKSKIKAKLCLS